MGLGESNKTSKAAVVIVFGRPGAGKTTVAEEATQILTNHIGSGSDGCEDLKCLTLDLDVCVPQWMRDNFAKGIYPTLQERSDFAEASCKYVDKCLEEAGVKREEADGTRNIGALISFSFVNTDLREIFRLHFPDAVWVLVDTDEQEATERINRRQGHFYKGKSKGAPTEINDSTASAVEEASTTAETAQGESDNSEWEFAPVGFPHIVLDGTAPIKDNANKVAETFIDAVATRK